MIRRIITAVLVLETCFLGTALAQRVIETVDSVPELLTRIPSNKNTVFFSKGRTTPHDGGGGEFYWDSASTAAADGGTCFQASGVAVGRWHRAYSGAINVRWFGAKADGTDATESIQDAIDAASVNGGEVLVPPGTYTIATGPVNVNSGVILRGYQATFKNPAGTNRMVLRLGDIEPMTFTTNDLPVTQAEHCGVIGLTIDQNSQNSSNFDFAAPNATLTSHALYARSVNGLIIHDVTVQNANLWAIGVEFCLNVKIMHNTVLNGRGSHGYSGGVLYPLSSQDGIHVVDSSNVIINGNHVESSDDCVAVSANYTHVQRVTVTGNTLKNIALLASDPNKAMGRYCMSALIGGASADYNGQPAVGRVSNVTFANNSCTGGAGWFYIGNDLAASGSTQVVSSVTIEGNQYVGFTDQCVAAPIIFGGLIGYCEGVSIKNNRFFDCNRYVLHWNGVNGITWEGNEFRNFGPVLGSPMPNQEYAILYFYNDADGGPCTNIRILKNEASDLGQAFLYAGAPVGAPAKGGTIEVIGNTIERAALLNTDAAYGQAVIGIYNQTAPIVRDNTVRDARAAGIFVRSEDSDDVTVTGNFVENCGYNDSMTDAMGITVAGNAVQLRSAVITDNIVNGSDGYGISIQNPGAILCSDNAIYKPGRQSVGLRLGALVIINSETGSTNVFGTIGRNLVTDAATSYYMGASTNVTTAWAGSPIVFLNDNISLRESNQEFSIVNPDGATVYETGPRVFYSPLTLIDERSLSSVTVVSTVASNHWTLTTRSTTDNYSGFYSVANNIGLVLRDAGGDVDINITPNAASYINTGQVLGIGTTTPDVSKMLDVNGAARITGTLNLGTLLPSRAVVTDSNTNLVSSTTTAAEIGYVAGVTGPIQTQLGTKQNGSTILTNLSELGSTGVMVATGSGGVTTRTLQAGTGISITNPDGVSGDPTISFSGSTGADIEFQNDGTPVGTRPKLNVIPGANTTVSMVDEPASDRVNVTITAVGGEAGPSYNFQAPIVLTGSNVNLQANGVANSHLRQSLGTSVVGRSAGTPGNVSDIVASADNTFLRRSSGTLGFTAMPNNISVQKIRLSKNGTLVGQRQEVNLIPGDGMTITAVDNPAADRVDVTLSAAMSASSGTATFDSGLLFYPGEADYEPVVWSGGGGPVTFQTSSLTAGTYLVSVYVVVYGQTGEDQGWLKLRTSTGTDVGVPRYRPEAPTSPEGLGGALIVSWTDVVTLSGTANIQLWAHHSSGFPADLWLKSNGASINWVKLN